LVSNTRLAFQYIANKTDKIKYENSVDKEIVHLYKPLISKNIEVNNISAPASPFGHSADFYSDS
jgi:hypothetical protein